MVNQRSVAGFEQLTGVLKNQVHQCRGRRALLAALRNQAVIDAVRDIEVLTMRVSRFKGHGEGSESGGGMPRQKTGAGESKTYRYQE